MQEALYHCFYGDDYKGFLEDVTIIFITRTIKKVPKNKKNYWMKTLKTPTPDGLNS